MLGNAVHVLYLSRAKALLFLLNEQDRFVQFRNKRRKMKTVDVSPRYFKIFKQFNNISLSNITQISSRPTRIPFEIIKKLSLEKFRFSFRYNPSLPVQQRAIADIFEGGVMRVNFTQALKVSTTSTLFTCCKQSPRVYIFPGKRFERKGGLDNSRGRIVGIY